MKTATDLSTLPVRCSHFTLGNLKKSFFNIIIHYYSLLFILFNTSDYLNLRRKQIATVLQLYSCLFSFSASYYLYRLYSRGTPQEERVYWYGHVEACGSGLIVATWAEFQHSVVSYATDQCRKRLGLRISAEGGQWTLAVTLFAWHSSRHTPQPVLLRATDDDPQLALFISSNFWNNATDEQSFAIHNLVVTFSGSGEKWIIVFFWDNERK